MIIPFMISMASQYPFNRDVVEVEAGEEIRTLDEEEADVVETDEDVAQVEAEAEAVEVILPPKVDASLVEVHTALETAPTVRIPIRNA